MTASCRALVLAIVLVAAGCSGAGPATIVTGDDDDSPDAVDLSGDWIFTENTLDPVRTVECTDELTTRLFSFCDRFGVTLVQDGASFATAAPAATSCSPTVTMSGSATVDDVSGVVVSAEEVGDSPPVTETTRIEFTGVTIDNSATFAMGRLTVVGLDGDCLMGGTYLGQRTPSDD
jgi:hypothetical protein